MNIDWDLLRKQKETLFQTINKLEARGDSKAADDLEGILHLLDTIQDETAKALGERAVFGWD